MPNREVILKAGTYILMLQVENKNSDFMLSQINVHLFSSSLTNIKQIPTIADFLYETYSQLIINKIESQFLSKNSSTENVVHSNVNYSFSDLREKPNGSENLLIIQFFLKSEKTYLQLLLNRSENRKWRQRLLFKLDNMIFRTPNESDKVCFLFLFFLDKGYL